MGYDIPVGNFDQWVTAHTDYRYTVGVDLGQAQDPTAVAIIERAVRPDVKPGKRIFRSNTVASRISLAVRHLERLPLRMPYPDQARLVARLLYTAPLTGNSDLVVDATGVGRPVVDLFKKAGLRPIGVTITAGDAWSVVGRNYRVSKLLLVSRLQALLHTGDLKIAAGLTEAAALISELQDFRATFTESGAATFGARVGRHDDLVLATAIAAWYAVAGYERRATTKNVRIG